MIYGYQCLTGETGISVSVAVTATYGIKRRNRADLWPRLASPKSELRIALSVFQIAEFIHGAGEIVGTSTDGTTFARSEYRLTSIVGKTLVVIGHPVTAADWFDIAGAIRLVGKTNTRAARNDAITGVKNTSSTNTQRVMRATTQSKAFAIG